jgi:hypothetical protein
MLKITEDIRAAARRLLGNPEIKLDEDERVVLAAISEGKRKLIDGLWWQKVHNVVDRVKLDKLKAMADPAGNPNVHSREIASRKLAAFKARRPPGLRPEPPPLPRSLDEWDAMRKPSRRQPAATPARRGLPSPPAGVNNPSSAAVNTTEALAAAGVNRKRTKSVNTTDRNRDRHSPGYMADYMRRRRAADRPAKHNPVTGPAAPASGKVVVGIDVLKAKLGPLAKRVREQAKRHIALISTGELLLVASELDTLLEAWAEGETGMGPLRPRGPLMMPGRKRRRKR